TANGGGISGPLASNFWRTDNGNQPAAALLASQAAGATPPPDTTVYPQTYNGWQNLTSKTTASPYFATDDFCWAQCWYDEDVSMRGAGSIPTSTRSSSTRAIRARSSRARTAG